MSKELIPAERIEGKIYLLRGQKVMLDRDLAKLYGVETFVLNQAVKRKMSRFPKDFMFQLNKEEFQILISQFVMSSLPSGKAGWGGRRTLPYAFTEPGIAMLSSVLNSERAIQVNIQIMRTFIRLKQFLSNHKELREKVEEMEKKYDHQFKVVFDAIKVLVAAPEPKKMGKIGFQPQRRE